MVEVAGDRVASIPYPTRLVPAEEFVERRTGGKIAGAERLDPGAGTDRRHSAGLSLTASSVSSSARDWATALKCSVAAVRPASPIRLRNAGSPRRRRAAAAIAP